MTGKQKIGLYFGTYNPIHIGHLAIANHMAEFSDLDAIWMLVTPHNPHKQKNSLLENHHRLRMVEEAVAEYPKLIASDIEFHLPQPNYTIHTLVHLQEKYGDRKQFSILMGEDNLRSLHKWKNYQSILEDYSIYVYPRLGEGSPSKELESHPNIYRIDAPIMEISASFIRKHHALGKNIKPLLPERVWQYMDEMNFYRNFKP